MSRTEENLKTAFTGESLAMAVAAVAIGTSALMAVGCQQFRICNTGKCPMGIATQDPDLRAAWTLTARPVNW